MSGDGRALVQPKRLLQQMHGQEELHHSRLDTRVRPQAAGAQVSLLLLLLFQGWVRLGLGLGEVWVRVRALTPPLWALHFTVLFTVIHLDFSCILSSKILY